tara:strand:- start:525 stop:1325 length:801 start_codon:yes stop_codon:yes gene_type:complete
LNLSGKVCVITGASSGIGKSLSIKLASNGASVVLAARRNSKLESIVKEIEKNGCQAIGVKTDITKNIECQNLIDETIKQYGKIDLLLLGAGVSMWTPFEEISDISFFKDLMDTNYTGAVHCLYAALPHLISSNGMVVTCSTAQAVVGFTNHSGYAASKHALHGFLDTLDMELNGKVKFLEAFLGWIRGTNMRSNAFGPSGKKMGETKRKHSNNSVDVEDCTNKIIQAIINNKKTVYIPWKLRLIPFLDLFMGKYLRRKISKAVKSE